MSKTYHNRKEKEKCWGEIASFLNVQGECRKLLTYVNIADELLREITWGAPSGMIILIISCSVWCATIFKSCSVCMFKIWGKKICEDSPYVCAAARFHNRLGFKKSCSVSQALEFWVYIMQFCFFFCHRKKRTKKGIASFYLTIPTFLMCMYVQVLVI